MLATRRKLQECLKSVTEYLTPLLPLANCHMVEFFTENHWDKLVPEKLRTVLEGWDRTRDFNFILNKFWDFDHTLNQDNTELGNFIANSRRHCLHENENCLTTEQLQEKIIAWGGQMQPQINITAFMNAKKSYEVATMARLTASLYHATASTCCVEAGGGRGHLLVALSLAHHVPSLTVDCTADKLRNAAKRIQLIQKQWHAISKRSGNDTKLNSTNEQQNTVICKEKDTSKLSTHNTKNLEQLEIADNQNVETNIHSQVKRSLEVSEDENVHVLSKKQIECADVKLHRFAEAYITKDTNLVALVEKQFPELKDNVKILLTGLHTCGDLGPSSLRIFASAPSTSALFNVPCCYHLLTEDIGDESGFPMSMYLRDYRLGRNARMLAAQSMERVVSERQLPAKSLLYRALLQVLIKKNLPNSNISEGKLKRLSSKCDNFDQYFKMADDILNLELYDKLPQSCLSEIYKDMDCQWRNLVIFYLLRLCLAQVIENVILLDRLLFLMENDFEKVYLVKLFDPVLSPRCHGIVAVR